MKKILVSIRFNFNIYEEKSLRSKLTFDEWDILDLYLQDSALYTLNCEIKSFNSYIESWTWRDCDRGKFIPTCISILIVYENEEYLKNIKKVINDFFEGTFEIEINYDEIKSIEMFISSIVFDK